MTQIDIPFPNSLFEWTWFLIGFMLGRAGAQTDYVVKESDWFKSLSPMKQKVVEMALNFLHHFWIGMLFMIYAFDPIKTEMYWFGAGLFVDDIGDIPSRFKKWFGYLAQKLYGFLEAFYKP